MTASRSEKPDRRWLKVVLAAGLLLGLQIVLQLANHAFSSEYARTYDEAAHYVTGLMVRDFIAGLDWSDPMAFAEEYYLHYPKVALGHWPPGFYLIQSAWTLVFSTSRVSMMLLMAFLTTLLALIVTLILERKSDTLTAIGAGLVLVALPLTQISSTVVMGEIPLAILALVATLFVGRYFEQPTLKWSLGFSLMAALAIMTKANGLALGLVPIVALLLSRRFELIRRTDFWLPAFLTAAICGPWYLATLNMLKNGPLAQSPSWQYTMRAFSTSSGHLLDALGWGLATVATIGLVDKLLLPAWRRTLEGIWLALGSLLISVLLFHWIVPADFDPRHMFLAIPSAICFLGAGMARLASALPGVRLSARSRSLVVLTAVALVFMVQTFTIPGLEWSGFGQLADDLLDREGLQDSVFLVSSDPSGEGAFVSEVAQRERRPGHVILRATKVLAKSNWSGRRYKSLFTTPETLWKYLREVPVGIVVVDLSTPDRYLTADHHLLRETLADHANRWELIGAYPIIRDGTLQPEAVEVYRQKGHTDRRSGPIRIDLTEMLGRKIERASEPGPQNPVKP